MNKTKADINLKNSIVERILFDAGSVLAACAGSEVFVDLYFGRHNAERHIPFFIAAALLIVAINHLAGVYKQSPRRTLLTKLSRISIVAAAVFGALSLVYVNAYGTRPATWMLFAMAWFGSLAMMWGGRVAMQRISLQAVREVSRAMDDMTDNKVLVIGGGGYIGSALVPKLLNAGYEVTILDKLYFGEAPIQSFKDHRNLRVVREDFRNVEVLVREIRKAGPIIHLGGLVGDPACAVDPELTIDVNVTSTRLIGEIARANGNRRFIFASSCSVYGASPDIVDETSRFNPQSLYAQTKVASEAVLGELYDGHFCPTFLRFATIYGLSGRTRFDLVVNLLCAKSVRDGEITIFGSDQWRPFIHVDDVAEAVFRTLRAPQHLVANKAFNVGSNDQNMTLLELGQRIQALVPSAKIVITDENVDRRNYRVNFDRIRSVLDFEPVWSLERGIEQIVEIVRDGKVGDYTGVNYSNVRFLRQAGTEALIRRFNTGWEQHYLDRVDNDALMQSGGTPEPAPSGHSLPIAR